MKRMVCRSKWAALFGAAVLVLAAGWAGQTAQADDAASPTPAKTSATHRTRLRHLPPYFKRVVTEEQAEKIRQIQEEYQPKMEQLQKQLDTMKKDRDEKISAVLTPDQLKQVEEAKEKAKESRKETRESKKEAKEGKQDVKEVKKEAKAEKKVKPTDAAQPASATATPPASGVKTDK